MEEYVVLGTCPAGQLEGRHIKSYGVNANSVNNWGMPVGIQENTPEVIRTVTNRNATPVGISAPSICPGLDRSIIAMMNVFLSRSRQAVAVFTNDATVTLGDPVFVGDDGVLTTTVATGWKMGTVASPIGTICIDITGIVTKNWFLLELNDVEFVGV